MKQFCSVGTGRLKETVKSVIEVTVLVPNTKLAVAIEAGVLIAVDSGKVSEDCATIFPPKSL